MVPTKSMKTRFAFWRKATPTGQSTSPTIVNPTEKAAITEAAPGADVSPDRTETVTSDIVLSTTPTADATVTLDNSTAKEAVKNVDVPAKKSALRTFVSAVKTTIKTAGGKAATKSKKVFCCFSKQ